MIVLNETHAMALVNQLVFLLDEQIASAEKGHFERVEYLSKEASLLINEVSQAKALDYAACQDLQRKIKQRYKRLELILAAAKEMAKGELKQVQTTRKMLAVYRSSNR